MSTANFYSMENFPIVATRFNEYWEYEDFEEEIDPVIEEMNDSIMFHTISLKSGYHDGVQIYIEEKYDHEEDFSDWTNDDFRYYFDNYRSKIIPKYMPEIRKINRWLDKIVKDFGMDKLGNFAVFSNGEIMYTRIS